MGVCNCSMFCCSLLYVHSSIAVILMGKRKLVALLDLSSWCLVMVEWLFLTVSWGCLRFVIVVFPDHTHLLFLVGYHTFGPTLPYKFISNRRIPLLTESPTNTLKEMSSYKVIISRVSFYLNLKIFR